MTMTTEQKQILLADLCARLPYGVKCKLGNVNIITLFPQEIPLVGSKMDVKPYLRPMSSMTEEEAKEYNHTCEHVEIEGDDIFFQTCDTIDWLNAHHFDYRGLIEKGLALEAPEGIY